MSETLRQDAQTGEGQGSVLERHRNKLLYIAGAAGGAAAVFGASADVAHAQETVDPDKGTIILNESGDTIWDGQRQMGLTPEEIDTDLSLHGYDTQAKQAGLDWEIGKEWTVDPSVLAAKKQRELQQAIDRPIKTPAAPASEAATQPKLDPNTLYFVLKPGENVWSDLKKAGIPQENIEASLQYIKNIYKDVFDIDIDFNNLPVGFRYSLPIDYKIGFPKVVGNQNASPSTPQAPKPDPTVPVSPPAPTPPATPAKPEVVPKPEAPAQPVSPPKTETAPEKPAPAPTPPRTESVKPPATPEKREPQTIEEVLQKSREQYSSGGAEIAPMVAFIEKNLKHPEINPANGITAENVNKLYVLPDPQTGFDFIVNPLTCENQAITTATMLAAMIVTQDYAHWLTQNNAEFAHLKGKFRIQFGDMNDGQHRTHQFARAIDVRSSFIDNPGALFPDGPLFMSGAPGFDMRFNEEVMKFMINIKVMNQPFFRQLIVSSKQLEKNLTGKNKKGDWVAVVGGHHDHLHADAYEFFEVDNFFSPAQPLDCNDPSTGGPTEFVEPAPEITSPPTTSEPTDTTVVPPDDTAPTTTLPPESTTTTVETSAETVSVDSLLSEAAKNYVVQDAKRAYELSVQSVNNGGDLGYEASYGPQLEPGDVYIYLRKAGATHEEAVLLTAISMRETTLRPAAVGDVFHESGSGRKQPSYGLFQMMDIDGSGGIRDPQANLNPEKAAVNALTLARIDGFRHWESFMPDEINVMTLIDAVDLSHREMKSKQRKEFQERITDNVIELLGVLDTLRPLVDKALS